jgi:hypothetical protein
MNKKQLVLYLLLIHILGYNAVVAKLKVKSNGTTIEFKTPDNKYMKRITKTIINNASKKSNNNV